MRIALVTGSSRGIGHGIALALAAGGWTVALNGVRPGEQAQGALSAVKGLAPGSRYFQADISETRDRDRLLSQVETELGAIDLLVNNAGVAPSVRADILDADEASFDRLISTNLRGPYFLTQAVAARMLSRPNIPGRAIVFVTSISAAIASVNRGDYCVSKAGLSMAARLWAVRLSCEGIPVYEVRPGIIRSDMTSGVAAKYDQLIADGLTLEPRWGDPADVGKAVAMLARGDLAYSTGSVITVDGGLTVGRL